MRILIIFFCILTLSNYSDLTEEKDLTSWTHFTIDESLPGEAWGTGGPTLANYDIDGDGDIGIATKVWNGDGSNYHADF